MNKTALLWDVAQKAAKLSDFIEENKITIMAELEATGPRLLELQSALRESFRTMGAIRGDGESEVDETREAAKHER